MLSRSRSFIGILYSMRDKKPSLQMRVKGRAAQSNEGLPDIGVKVMRLG
jgi:hypothetical protein